MPLPRLLRLGRPVDPPPAAHDALYVGGRARAAHGEQPGLGLRRRHAGEGAHLGVRELPATQGLGEAWQRRWFLSSDTYRWLPPHPQVTRRNLSSAIVVHMCMAPHTLTLVTYTESIGSLP